MSIDKNIDLFSDFEIAVKNNATFATFEINGKKYPTIRLKQTPWIAFFSDNQLEILERKFNSKNIKIMTFNISKLEKVEVSLAKTFLGSGPGIFMTPMIITKVKLHFKEEHSPIVLLCETFEMIPEVIQWFRARNVVVEDLFSLEKIFEEVDSKKLQEYIHEKYDEIVGKSVKDHVYISQRAF